MNAETASPGSSNATVAGRSSAIRRSAFQRITSSSSGLPDHCLTYTDGRRAVGGLAGRSCIRARLALVDVHHDVVEVVPRQAGVCVLRPDAEVGIAQPVA
jgi:hypothetical protein